MHRSISSVLCGFLNSTWLTKNMMRACYIYNTFSLCLSWNLQMESSVSECEIGTIVYQYFMLKEHLARHVMRQLLLVPLGMEATTTRQ